MDKLSSRMTKIIDEYPSFKKTEVTLAIYHLDPDLVTKKLGILPYFQKKLGVPWIMPSGKERIGNMNTWLFSSEASNSSSKDIRIHLNWLLDKIEPVGAQLQELQELLSVKMAIRCQWWSKYGWGGPTLWPEQMERMARLNLECTFSFVESDDEDKATE